MLLFILLKNTQGSCIKNNIFLKDLSPLIFEKVLKGF